MMSFEQSKIATAARFGARQAKERENTARRATPVTLLFLLLYTVFLLSLATVYCMNCSVITAYAAVSLLSGYSIAAILLLFRIIQSK